MRLPYIIITTALLLFSGVAIAGPPPGEPAIPIDLTVIPGGPLLFLKCSRSGDDLTNCGLVSLWQQSNGAPGLQTIQMPFGGQARPRDTLLLG